MTQDAPEKERQADAAAARGDAAAARQLLQEAVREAPQRMQGWLKLAMISRALRDVDGALEAISGALRIAPLDFTALLTKASLLDLAGRSREADLAYGHALAQRPPDDNVPPVLKPVVAQAERRYRAYQEGVAGELTAAAETVVGVSPVERRRLERFCTNIARTTQVFHSDPTHFHYPGLPELEFHDPELFGWIATVEAATDEIRQEFRNALEAEAAELVPYVDYPEDLPLRQWRALNRSRDWTAIHLLRNGQAVEANARHCPRTMELLRSLPQPQVPGRSPNAMFSLLAPKTRIPPHTGVANTRLVAHLPLIVPPECGFRVGAETRGWEEGRILVFDDTIEHEAWNDSNELRVVFIFDLWHWALSDAERQAVAAVMAASDVDSSGGL